MSGIRRQSRMFAEVFALGGPAFRADRICVVKKVSLVAEGTPADIFYDASILEESGLKKPDIVRIYESLCKDMCLEQEDRPVNVEALVRCISSKAKK